MCLYQSRGGKRITRFLGDVLRSAIVVVCYFNSEEQVAQQTLVFGLGLEVLWVRRVDVPEQVVFPCPTMVQCQDRSQRLTNRHLQHAHLSTGGGSGGWGSVSG